MDDLPANHSILFHSIFTIPLEVLMHIPGVSEKPRHTITTTVRLKNEDRYMLDQISSEYHIRSSEAFRTAIKLWYSALETAREVDVVNGTSAQELPELIPCLRSTEAQLILIQRIRGML